MELVIDRGVKSYDVKDADGTLLGIIKINPADIGISGRFVTARNAIAELAEQAKQDMTPEKILAMDTTIKAELNKVFGSDVSSVFFLAGFRRWLLPMTVLLSLKRCWKLLPLWWRRRTRPESLPPKRG